MQVPFQAVRLTHHRAPVDIRELIYLPSDTCINILHKLREILGVQEALVFSTCNRTEVYYQHQDDISEQVIKLLCIENGIEHPERYFPYFEIIQDEKEAARTLFSVSMGLSSTVLGDLQISNQIKKAYIQSNDAGMAQAYLHRLLHTIFHTNKRVHQETSFRDGAASVSYAASELAADLSQHMQAPKALVIGLGEMGQDVAKSLDPEFFAQIDICNRTQSKAEKLARQIQAGVLPLELLPQQMADYDVILSAVSVDEPLIRSEFFTYERVAPQYIIDLCVPRSVAKEVEHVPFVVHYGVDDIQSITERTLDRRKAAIPHVQKIIEEELVEFFAWRQQLSFSSTIQQLKSALEEIRKEELARFLRKANPQEAELLEEATRSMVQKIVKLPVLQLKEACKRGQEEEMIGIINDIFNLEKRKTTQEA
ncbi:MAG: glutamyl-tRNA reductase [Bacteroidota bacterium]